MIIAYGTENITLNKGSEHMTISRKDLEFIVESAIRNQEVIIEVKSTK